MDNSGTESAVYLDYNATAPLRPEALAAMTQALAAVGNASSVHQPGREAAASVERARDQVALLLGCRPGEITFTSGATEANNIALRSGLSRCAPIVISAVEHPAVAEAAEVIAADCGAALRVVSVDAGGLLDMEELRAALVGAPSLVSVMAANNETGVLCDLATVSKLAHDAGALVHTDATQLVGRLPVDVGELDVDFLTLSAHKFGGPQGVGAIYARRGLPVRPLAFGGSHERGRRPGTLNVAGIVGLGAAAAAARSQLSDESTRIGVLRDRFETALVSTIEKVRRNGRVDRRLPGVSSLTFLGAPADAVLAAMPLVAASEGSACAAGAPEPSHVLTAMGLSREDADCTIRFSMGHATTDDDVTRALDYIARAVNRVRTVMGIDPGSLPNPEPAERISE